MFDTHEVETYLTHLSKNHIFRTNIIPPCVWKRPHFSPDKSWRQLSAYYSILAVWVEAKKNEGEGKRFYFEYTSLNAVDHSVREPLGFILGGRGVIQNRGPARDKGRIRLPLVMAQQLAALPTTEKHDQKHWSHPTQTFGGEVTNIPNKDLGHLGDFLLEI